MNEESNRLAALLTRRRVLVASGALAALTMTTRAAARQATPAAASGWEYTDVLGNTVRLPEPPKRIAAAINVAAALHDFGIDTPIVFGWTATHFPDGDHVAWGRLDAATVEVVSDSEGNIELEPLLTAKPDLIVTWTWDKDNAAESLVAMPPELAEPLAKIAPVVVLNQGDANAVELERIEQFAAALGADLNGPEIAAARTAYEAKLDETRRVAQDKADLTVLFASFGTGPIYVASPDYVADLGMARDLGLKIANDGSPTGDTYWEELSEENALHYPSDVLYIDQYGPAQTVADLQKLPTIGQMPAVKAGQAGPWKRDLPISYPGLTDFLETLLVPLRDAKKVR